MASELKGNAIVSGYIDFYCLVCECHLRGGQDARIHIDTPLHRENLPLYPYLEQYQQDCIRKIKKLYFCELCDLTFTTIAKVKVHSKEADHIYKIGEQHIKRIKNYVVVSDAILITELVWNGILADSTCTVCNTEVDDVAVHLVEQKHLLKLIGMEVHFSEGIIYRKIDETSFHCLVCNMLVASNTISTHSINETHKKGFLNCRADFDSHAVHKDPSVTSKTTKDKTNGEAASAGSIEANRKREQSAANHDNTSNCDQEIKKSSTKDAVFEQISEFQKNGIKINFESEIVSCNKCSETMNFDTEIIKQHIVSHQNNATKNKANLHVIQPSHSKTDIRNKVQKKSEQSKDTTPEIESDDEIIKIDVRKRSDAESNHSSSTDDDCEGAAAGPSKLEEAQSSVEVTASQSEEEATSFAKQNDITYNFGRSDAYCRTCSVRLPSTLKSMTEHVNGAPHKSKSMTKTRQENYFGNEIKVPMRSYIKTNIFVRHVLALYIDALINDKLCISKKSFHLITGLKKLRCQVCEENLSESEIDEHEDTSAHKNSLGFVPVMTNWKTEFIREVRSGIFHCGFCNLVVGSWSDTEKHLKCLDHRRNKSACQTRLEEHLPHVQMHRIQQRMEISFMMHLLNGLL